MKILKLFILCLTIFFSISCTQDKKNTVDIDEIFKQVKQDTKIELPSFLSIEKNYNSALGDYSKSFIIKFDSTNFEILIRKIETSIKCAEISNEVRNNQEEFVNITWVAYESGYRFENYFFEKKSRSNYYVNTKNRTLFYLYVEE